MGEKLRISILTKLSNNFTTSQLKIINDVITAELCQYDIKEISTNIMVYQGLLPNEVKSFLVCKKIKGLTESSLKHYKQVLTHFCLNVNNDIKQLTTNDIRLYLLSYEQTHNIGKSSLDDKRRILNSFFSWMLREEIINNNPMLKIDVIKCDKKLKDTLTPMEIEQMRNACSTNRQKAMIEFLYSTGVRVSEMISINKNDIDFKNSRVKVLGKGNKERWCFINAKAEFAIRKYILSRTDDECALFVMSKRPYSRLGKGTVEKEINEIAKKANINKNVTPHTYRRTMATQALANGAQLSDIQLMLGHTSSQTTLRYAQLDIQNLQQIHKRCII